VHEVAGALPLVKRLRLQKFGGIEPPVVVVVGLAEGAAEIRNLCCLLERDEAVADSCPGG
jgi:hypothetical protein